jgi:hypothetical protein
MTGDRGWFSSLVPVVTKRYITVMTGIEYGRRAPRG